MRHKEKHGEKDGDKASGTSSISSLSLGKKGKKKPGKNSEVEQLRAEVAALKVELAYEQEKSERLERKLGEKNEELRLSKMRAMMAESTLNSIDSSLGLLTMASVSIKSSLETFNRFNNVNIRQEKRGGSDSSIFGSDSSSLGSDDSSLGSDGSDYSHSYSSYSSSSDSEEPTKISTAFQDKHPSRKKVDDKPTESKIISEEAAYFNTAKRASSKTSINPFSRNK